MARKALALKGDLQMNTTLREEVQSLRGCMSGVAEQQPIPTRFRVKADEHIACMHITDTTTKKTTMVPLFAYREVRKAIYDLIGE